MATKTCENDCSYNCIKQLTKKLKFLWNVDGYIKDAKKCGHKDCAKTFEIIKKDEQKHSEMIKKLIVEKARKGEL